MLIYYDYKTVFIMSGPSGTGKSTIAKEIVEKRPVGSTATICSTDNYFETPDGYVWKREDLGKAHAWNFSKYKEALQRKDDYIVIDNTNLSFSEIRPYYLEAIRNNYLGEIVWRDTKLDVDVLFNRNLHGVPRETIETQIKRYEALKKRFLNGEEKEMGREVDLQVQMEKLGKEKSEAIFKKTFKI